MDKLSNLALVQQMLDSAEKSIQSAKHLLREILGTGASVSKPVLSTETATLLAASGGVGGKIIEGTFDGQNMIGPDGKQYPVPANYASKSKLVEGDGLKLTIADDGTFIYKQISPVERKRVLGILAQDERGDYRVVAEGKSYKVLLASLTYFKAEPGDEVSLEVPTSHDSAWGAVVNVIKRDGSSVSVPAFTSGDTDGDLEAPAYLSGNSAVPAIQPEDEEL